MINIIRNIIIIYIRYNRIAYTSYADITPLKWNVIIISKRPWKSIILLKVANRNDVN